MKSNHVDLSVVIACYNEAEHIKKSLPELISFLDLMKINYEVIIIDDCSKDNTRALLSELVKKYPSSKLIFHGKNIGRGGTVKEGMLMSKGTFTGFLDIDLETPAWYISPAYKFLQQGAEVVCAKRVYKFNLGKILREILSKGYNGLMKNMLGVSFSDSEAGFKFFKTEKIKNVLKETQNEGWFFDTEIMVRSYYQGLKMRDLPTLFIRKDDKTSTVNVLGDSWDYFVNLKKFKPVAQRLRKNGHKK